jgi:hypothetical protein
MLAILILTGIAATPSSAHDLEQPACASAYGWLFLERESQGFVLDPARGEAAPIDLSPATIEYLLRPFGLADPFIAPQWDVQRASGPDAYAFTVHDPGTGELIISATFERRIEIAASTVSPTGRFTVFIQSNNLASEITVLDASTAERRDVRLPHGEKLAAFAIGSAFSRDESCLAVSMERVGGNGPETWLVSMETGSVSSVIPGFVITWT